MRALTKTIVTISIVTSFCLHLTAQVTPIIDYNVDTLGSAIIKVASTEDNYYLLKVKQDPQGSFQKTCASMTLGEPGTTTIMESLEALPEDQYQVLEISKSLPGDQDRDGIDDLTEFLDMPQNGPFNAAEEINRINGAVSIPDRSTFEELSIDGIDVPWATFLSNQEFVKFAVSGLDTDSPELYFINSNSHQIHDEFYQAIGWFDMDYSGEIVYHPHLESNNGTKGIYSFAYTFGEGKNFNIVQQTHELIAANMPFLRNNLSYFVTAFSKDMYERQQGRYDDSRVPILLEETVYANVDYVALNVAEGFGFFRLMEVDEIPGSKDIVLYQSLPNNLPRVGGIMTSFIQTPLSHVNLRAIQDGVPNAFIRNPLEIDSIANLLDKYIYYKVEGGNYTIREATLDEVNDWFESLRPEKGQEPVLNLDYKDILPLDEIEFEMADGFGAKCANVATMRTFGFPFGTIPDGFGVPFYYYQEFMKFNGFFEEVREMIAQPDFRTDLDTRVAALKDFRKRIKDAEMPDWMLDELDAMHKSFPDGTSVRCRSSTNNEDLPGFSGAGLYTSKTQHPDEGHMQKSIKQVYASMWNFRAFEERDFYRIDHYKAAMGVLCHPNYSDEKANGVGVSLDPLYGTYFTFYLNTQIGEDLVTNPNALSIPEEVLLEQYDFFEDRFIRYSNLVPEGEEIMTIRYRDQMRDYLMKIHEEFAILYDAEFEMEFAMDIEYKITSEDQLIIKQARPWASYWTELEPNYTSAEDIPLSSASCFPNPMGDYLWVESAEHFETMALTDVMGRIHLIHKADNSELQRISTSHLTSGQYILIGWTAEGRSELISKVVK